MDLQLSAAHLRFRNALRAWLAANLPRPWREELREPGASETSLVELRRAWQRKLYQAGYLGMDWPHEWGGRGGTEVEKSIMEAELARADAPPILNILGVGLLGPALIHHGTEAQRRRFIPPMLAGDEIWCQGFSEPGAGSDLAALKTAARLDGDHFVLNGQKVWTTFGPWADWIFVLTSSARRRSSSTTGERRRSSSGRWSRRGTRDARPPCGPGSLGADALSASEPELDAGQDAVVVVVRHHRCVRRALVGEVQRHAIADRPGEARFGRPRLGRAELEADEAEPRRERLERRWRRCGQGARRRNIERDLRARDDSAAVEHLDLERARLAREAAVGERPEGVAQLEDGAPPRRHDADRRGDDPFAGRRGAAVRRQAEARRPAAAVAHGDVHDARMRAVDASHGDRRGGFRLRGRGGREGRRPEGFLPHHHPPLRPEGYHAGAPG